MGSFYIGFPKRFFDLIPIQKSLHFLSISPSRNCDWKNISLEYFCKFKNLNALNMENMGIKEINEIPACLNKLIMLKMSNIYHGTITWDWRWPNFFWNISKLGLDLRGWEGNITLPKGRHANIQSLNIINMPENSFRVSDFGSKMFPDLTEILIHESSLSGRIPEFNSSSLKILSLHRNSFRGPFPINLFRNKNIETVRLNWNIGVNGTLPFIEKSRSRLFQCMFFHGTSMITPIPLNYFASLGILTYPATNANLSNLTGDPSDGDCVYQDDEYCRYGKMECKFLYFAPNVRKAYKDNHHEYTPGIFCYGKDFFHCGSKSLDGDWNLLEVGTMLL